MGGRSEGQPSVLGPVSSPSHLCSGDLRRQNPTPTLAVLSTRPWQHPNSPLSSAYKRGLRKCPGFISDGGRADSEPCYPLRRRARETHGRRVNTVRGPTPGSSLRGRATPPRPEPSAPRFLSSFVKDDQ